MSTECGAARRLLLDRSTPSRFQPRRSPAELHVGSCAECRKFNAECDVTVRLAKESLSVTAPDDLRERLFESVADARVHVLRTHRFPYVAAAIVAASVAGIFLGRSMFTRSDVDATIVAIVADHAVTGVDERIRSNSAVQIEAWLSARVSHAVMVPTLTGAVVVGARLSGTPQGRGAVVEYEIDGGRVSYFTLVAPPGTPIHEGVKLAAAKGYSIAHWQHRGLVHAFVGALPADRVKSMAQECIHQAESRLAATYRSRDTPGVTA